MNKGEFVKKVATKLDGEYTQAEAAKMVDACLLYTSPSPRD